MQTHFIREATLIMTMDKGFAVISTLTQQPSHTGFELEAMQFFADGLRRYNHEGPSVNGALDQAFPKI